MTKRILLTFFVLLLIVGILAGIKALQVRRMIEAGSQFVPPPETVTTALVRPEQWETTIGAVGSLEAVQGVTVSAEQAGKVTAILFSPGAFVRQGALLARQDTAAEEARLRSLESARNLARTNLRRMAELVEKGLIAQADYDSAEAAFRQAEAESDNIRAVISKKSIHAPFNGRLGIRLVNLGQILREGDPIVSLQAPDPLFVNFLLPQQELARLKTGMAVRLKADGTAAREVTGQITTINPHIEASTRNVRVQATVANSNDALRPGMFVGVSVLLPEKENVLIIPATAVLHAPYGDSVFIVEEGKEGGQPLVLRQEFVRLGERRGDFVAVLSGLAAGETVTTTGVFKLRNGQSVVVDNSLSPEFRLTPTPENS